MKVAPLSTIPAPIAIGGLGGSGTRVFSALLQHAGFYTGSDLNESLDNLWFTVLFKRKKFVEQTATSAELDQATRLFVTAMTTGLGDDLSVADRALLKDIENTIPPKGDWRVGVAKPTVDRLIQSSASHNTSSHGWGWKEPNTHVFLEALDQRIEGLRYIHIVRNGLDMAFSESNWQAVHWGEDQDKGMPLPVRQLRFWTVANRKAIDYGTAHMGDRFFVIGYEAFCAQPHLYWERLTQFLGRDSDVSFPDELINPTSIGRSQTRDLSMFSSTDLAAADLITQQVAQLIALP